MTEQELRTIVDVSHEDGVIESEERQMIYNVFDFGDSQAKDVMVPRIDMSLINVDATYDEVFGHSVKTVIHVIRSMKIQQIPSSAL